MERNDAWKGGAQRVNGFRRCGKVRHSAPAGYAAALTSILIWGTTFIVSKVILEDFRPVEVILIRMVLGLAALLLASPRLPRARTASEELSYAAAGLCGIVLYFLLENTALTHGLASNVGVIISAAPFFTATLNRFFYRSDRLQVRFFVGFALAMTGIGLISFNGVRMQISPLGDLLALGAAASWGLYSVLVRRAGGFGLSTLQATQRIFLYGVLFLAILSPFLGLRPNLAHLVQPKFLLPFLYLGLGASALCFFAWNFAVEALGPVRTSVSAYLIPVVAVAAGALALGEPVTPLSLLGTGLILGGLAVSEWRAGRG